MADALAAMLDHLGYAAVDLLAIGRATPLGCTLARRHSDTIGRVVLDGCCSLETDDAATLRERIAPAFPFDSGGGHIQRYWHMLRDGEANWPWYDGAAGAARGLPPVLAAQPLHDGLVGILKQPERYGDAARAGCQPDDAARYPGFTQPALLLGAPHDPAYGGTQALAERLANATTIERATDLHGAARSVAGFLAQSALVGETVA
jgi:pimeloyl-ACP methyl ester carboxylesterase